MRRIQQFMHRGEQGQSLLEFALVVPVLMIIFFGIFDFGRVIFEYAQVMNGAREGARYGSVSGTEQQQATINGTQYRHCDGIRAAVTRTFAVPVDVREIRIQYDDGATLYPIECVNATIRPGPSDIELGDRIRVTVTARFGFITPVLSSFGPITLSFTSARTVMAGGTLVPPGSD